MLPRVQETSTITLLLFRQERAEFTRIYRRVKEVFWGSAGRT